MYIDLNKYKKYINKNSVVLVAFLLVGSYVLFLELTESSAKDTKPNVNIYSPGGIIEGSPHKDLTYAHYSPNREHVIHYNEGYSVRIDDDTEFTNLFKALPTVKKPNEIQITYWISDEELVYFYENAYSLPDEVMDSGYIEERSAKSTKDFQIVERIRPFKDRPAGFYAYNLFTKESRILKEVEQNAKVYRVYEFLPNGTVMLADHEKLQLYSLPDFKLLEEVKYSKPYPNLLETSIYDIMPYDYERQAFPIEIAFWQKAGEDGFKELVYLPVAEETYKDIMFNLKYHDSSDDLPN